MNARDLAHRLCGDVVHGVYERRGRTFIVTTFPYPSGDLITLYVTERGGDTFVSDQGTTNYYLATDGVDLTDARRDTIDSICTLHGVHFDGNALERQVHAATAGVDTLSLCQAIVRVSDLHYDRTGRKAPQLAVEVESLVEAKIAPRRTYVANWTDSERDPNQSHPVDYHFNGTGVPSNLFVIASAHRVDAVTSIIQFWQRHFEEFKALCVVADGVSVSLKAGDRLRTAANEVVIGIGGNESLIVGFALSEARYVSPLTLSGLPKQGGNFV